TIPRLSSADGSLARGNRTGVGANAGKGVFDAEDPAGDRVAVAWKAGEDFPDLVAAQDLEELSDRRFAQRAAAAGEIIALGEQGNVVELVLGRGGPDAVAGVGFASGHRGGDGEMGELLVLVARDRARIDAGARKELVELDPAA